MDEQNKDFSSKDETIKLTEEGRNIIRYCVEERYQQELMAMNSSDDAILRENILQTKVEILERVLNKLKRIRDKEIQNKTNEKSMFF